MPLMGGRTRRRWRFWRRALGVALCWRNEYEPCGSDDGSRISQRTDHTRGSLISDRSPDDGSRISQWSCTDSPRGDATVGSMIDARGGSRDVDRRTAERVGRRHYHRDVAGRDSNNNRNDSGNGSGNSGDDVGGKDTGNDADDRLCCPSAVLRQLATMEQPISIRCPKTGDVIYKIDLIEETLECMGDGRRRSRSLTFLMDHKRTDNERLTLYGLLAPGCETWTMAFVKSSDDKACSAHVCIRPNSDLAL